MLDERLHHTKVTVAIHFTINTKKTCKKPAKVILDCSICYLCFPNCQESLRPWKTEWSPADGVAAGCDRESSRMALTPGFSLLRPNSSPAPSLHVSDSASCDYRGSGTWGGI